MSEQGCLMSGKFSCIESAHNVYLRADYNIQESIYLHSDGGTGETIKIHSDLGTGVGTSASIYTLSDAGGITLQSTSDLAQSIYLYQSGSGVNNDTIKLHSTSSGSESINILSENGGIELYAENSTHANSIHLISDEGGINIEADDNITMNGNVVLSNAIQGLFSGIYNSVDLTVSTITSSYKTKQAFINITGHATNVLNITDTINGDIILLNNTSVTDAIIQLGGTEQDNGIGGDSTGIFLVTNGGNADSLIQFSSP